MLYEVITKLQEIIMEQIKVIMQLVNQLNEVSFEESIYLEKNL